MLGKRSSVERQREDVHLLEGTTPQANGAFFQWGTPQEGHQQSILRDFQSAVRTNDQAETCLRDAERVAAQAALALVEARKRMRRVTDGVV